MPRTFAILAIGLLCAFLYTGCGDDPPPSPAEQRSARLAQSTGDIVVGVSWMWAKELDLMRQGIEMATAEINDAGGVDGRPLRLIWGDDEERVDKGLEVARGFAANTDMVAVIGHSTSSITLKAAPIYDEAGILLLAPGATHPSLTGKGYKRLFRTIPSDADAGLQLANFASQQGFRRIGICYIDNAYGQALAKVFEDKKFGSIEVVDRMAYRPGQEVDFSATAEVWRELRPDAVILIATLPQGAHFIAQARQAGLDVPIIGADGLDSAELWQIAGPAAEGTIVFSIFHPGTPQSTVRSFVRGFEKHTGQAPDVWAALGYDTVRLLADAIQRAGNSDPAQLAAVLRQLKDWDGVTGPMSFGSTGELMYKPLTGKIVRGDRFENLLDGMLR